MSHLPLYIQDMAYGDMQVLVIRVSNAAAEIGRLAVLLIFMRLFNSRVP